MRAEQGSALRITAPAAPTPRAAGLARFLALLRRHAWWFVGTATVALLAAWQPRALQRLDLLAYDQIAPQLAAPVGTAQALVVAIDDASIAQLGRWPWPRARHAELAQRLHEAGAAALGFALLFSESDAVDPAGDAALAAALQQHGHAVLALAPTRAADGRMAELAPLPALAQAARAGHVDVEIDADGQSRRLPLRAGADAPRHPAFALAMAQAVGGAPADADLPGAQRSRDAAPGHWARNHEVLLPRAGATSHVSYARLLQSPELAAQARGRAVFVGITAPGLGGELVTPLAGTRTAWPAVDFHAHAYASIRGQALITPLGLMPALLLALLAVSSLALWPTGARGRRHVVLAGVLLAGPLLTSMVLLHAANLWLPPALGLTGLLVAYALWSARQLAAVNRQLQRARRHAQATLHAIDDGVITVDPGGTVRYANPMAQLQSGGTLAPGMSVLQALPLDADSLARLETALASCLADARPVRLTSHLHLHLPNEHAPRFLQVAASPLLGPRDQLDGAVLVLVDVSDAVAAAHRADHAATHDALTGLPNRVLLQDRLGLAIARGLRRNSAVAVLFLDLNRFKRINDSLGHRQGDEVLKIVAQRLRRVCRETDLVSRWGGDEFVVVVEDLSGQDGAAAVAGKVVAALREDIELGELRLPSACSVGIAMAPQDGCDADALLARADMAMYRAKAQPGTGYHFYSSELNVWTRERLALEVDLRQALRDGNFELHYQPQYALEDFRLVGFEALLRWRRTPEELLTPGSFIGVAEESGLIVDIGEWVVQQAARDVAAWRAAGLQAAPVGVNVSARQCLNRGIVDVVREALRETGIPPSLLKIELTETTAMTDAQQVIRLLEDISALGVRIAVDDFGTGYSSLSYLKRFPIDELKIDQSFVRDLASDEDDAAIVRATIALAHGLGILVVAEGVETEQQSLFLAAHRCDVAQGYLFGSPQPRKDATTLL